MLTEDVSINGTSFRVTLTEHTIEQIKRLKILYAVAYEDTESFEDVSTEISNTIQNISCAAEPPISDENLDGFIQEMIKMVDKVDEIKQEAKSITRKARLKKK